MSETGFTPVVCPEPLSAEDAYWHACANVPHEPKLLPLHYDQHSPRAFAGPYPVPTKSEQPSETFKRLQRLVDNALSGIYRDTFAQARQDLAKP